LLVGAGISQFFPRPTPFLLVLVPLAMTVGVGALLMDKGGRREAGKALLIGGAVASVALPFILL